MTRLGDVCSIRSSGHVSDKEKNWLLNLDVVEQQTGRVLEYCYVSDSGLNGSIISFDTDNVLYSKLRPNLNKVVVPETEGYATSEMLPLFPDKSLITREYLACYLRSPGFVEWAVSKTAGAKMPRLGTKELLNKEIPLPPLDMQKKVTGCLNKIDFLISLRKKQLQKLDDLVKSRFVEMFGDPETNPFGWDKVSIPAVMRDKASNGFFAKREDYVQDGNVSVLGVAYVVNRMYSQVENLPQTNATAQDIRKYSVKYGDMLFCRSSLVAEGIGKASIVPENTPANVLFECHVIRIPLDLKICVPEFMQVQSTMDYFRKQMIAQSKTATMTTIGQDGIMKAIIILPPIEKQKEFYNFLKNVDKAKLTVQQGLDKLELIKQSLMQKYFG